MNLAEQESLVNRIMDLEEERKTLQAKFDDLKTLTEESVTDALIEVNYFVHFDQAFLSLGPSFLSSLAFFVSPIAHRHFVAKTEILSNSILSKVFEIQDLRDQLRAAYLSNFAR